jgi:hypothetical protein
MMPPTRCVPSGLVTRDCDNKLGMIVACDRKFGGLEQQWRWTFVILIDGSLTITTAFGSHYSMVQTW